MMTSFLNIWRYRNATSTARTTAVALNDDIRTWVRSLTVRVVAVDVEDGTADHLADVGRVDARASK
jgi:hypothetical protein